MVRSRRLQRGSLAAGVKRGPGVKVGGSAHPVSSASPQSQPTLLPSKHLVDENPYSLALCSAAQSVLTGKKA